ncbi:hypothetical protein DOTSEDRAFT_52423 [Dothistroma septosporum NZE10]|uniref:Zn(2)-C6 fungal-type domain-containing protein n=1 Tax=Dothistroma septosporum (strain NZE10 / CBS 128990) TaxID=675120 RepID=N1PRN0_DOTSN|nr:hypothetical protein DOTSEDRAFT_52423 [Dothistroma septosporum NZE10]
MAAGDTEVARCPIYSYTDNCGPTDCRGQANDDGLGDISRGPYASLIALTNALKAEIAAAKRSSIPECTTCELSLKLTATLPLVRPGIGLYAKGQQNDLPQDFKDLPTISDGADATKLHPGATCEAIVNLADAHGRAIVQRAASRGVIQAVEAADGYRYSFNNAWTAKDEEGSRFSFICQDSMQNKDRHANGFTRTMKHRKGETNDVRGPRKPTYDCKGSVSVKFSSGKQRVDVYYRHYAIHQTVAGRKLLLRPPPRPRPEVSATNGTLVECGGLLATLQAENFTNKALLMVNDQSPMIGGQSSLTIRPEVVASRARPLKRKRESLPLPPASKPPDPSKPLSLSELLASSYTANNSASPIETPTVRPPKFPPPVAYELPAWQTPPPPLTAIPSDPPYTPPPYPPTRANTFHPVGEVAISITPRSGPLPQQFRPGAPTGTPGPGQCLCTTMKQIDHKTQTVTWQQLQTPFFHTFGPRRQRGSKACTNCRQRRTRCDEGIPCSACVKSGRTDCFLVDPQHTPQPRQPHEHSASTWGSLSQPGPPPQLREWQQQQQQQAKQYNSAGPAAQQQSAQPGIIANTTKQESPDPWFPKR